MSYQKPNFWLGLQRPWCLISPAMCLKTITGWPKQ